jgi:hypothetical protein
MSKEAYTSGGKESGDEPRMLWEGKLGRIHARGHARVGKREIFRNLE